MLLSTLLVVFAFLFASAQPHHLQSRSPHSSKNDIYRKLQARIVPVVSSSTSRVHYARRVQPVTKRHSKRQATISSRISAALTQFLQTLDEEGAKIKSYAVKDSTPESIVSQVQQPLQNILKAAQKALADIKNCEYSPGPSGSFQTPPSSACPLLVRIIQCLKNILSSLQSVLDQATLHQSLGDIFTQITETVAQIISEIDSKIPGTIKDLAEMGRDVLDSVRFDGYGFGKILDVVRPL